MNDDEFMEKFDMFVSILKAQFDDPESWNEVIEINKGINE